MVLSIPPLIATNTFPFLLIKNEACLPAGGLQIYAEFASCPVSKFVIINLNIQLENCRNTLFSRSKKTIHLTVKMQALFITAFIFSIQFLPAQPADLDPEKWVAALSKKNRSSYDSLPKLTIILQKIDSLKAFQFVDELA